MKKEILMFYGKECLNASLMMPLLNGLNLSGKYKIDFLDIWHDEAAKKAMDKYDKIIKKTGKEDHVPIFVDESKKEAFYAPDAESLMEWLEGPNWWKT